MIEFFDTTLGKTLKAVAYVGASAVVGFLLTETTNNPDLFGVYTIAVNGLLVFLKGLLTPSTPNLPK